MSQRYLDFPDFHDAMCLLSNIQKPLDVSLQGGKFRNGSTWYLLWKNGQKNHAWVSSFFLVVPCTCPVQETWMFHCEAASLDWIQHGTFAENKHSEKTQTVKCMPCIQWFMSTLMFQMLALRPFPLLGRDSKPWRLGVRLGKVASLHLIILGDFGSFQVSICGWNPFASHKRISFFSGAM